MFFLTINRIIINVRDNRPHVVKPIFCPKCSIENPVNRFPIGVLPKFTREYTLITLPLNSSDEFNCKLEFAIFINTRLQKPIMNNIMALEK